MVMVWWPISHWSLISWRSFFCFNLPFIQYMWRWMCKTFISTSFRFKRDKAKTSGPIGVAVFHYHTVNHITETREIRQQRFLSSIPTVKEKEGEKSRPKMRFGLLIYLRPPTKSFPASSSSCFPTFLTLFGR